MSVAVALFDEDDLVDRPAGALTVEQLRMVEANLPLVRWVIQKYLPRTPDHEFDDKVADGTLGLIRAVQKFDPDKGFRFSTYAVNWIRSAIQRGHASYAGIGWRQSVGYDGQAPLGTYEAPLSLDAPPPNDPEGRTLGEGMASTGDPIEDQVITSVMHGHLVDALLGMCRDDIDRAAVESITTGEATTVVAERLGLAPSVVRARKGRLLCRARHPVTGILAPAAPGVPTNKEERSAMTTSTVPFEPPPVADNANGNGHAPTPPPETFSCEDCGRPGKSRLAVAIHRSRAHGVKGATRGTPPRTPKLDSASVRQALEEDGYDPWAVIVGAVEDDAPRAHTVILSTRHDAAQVAALLASLGHKAWTVHLADATPNDDDA